MRRCSTRYLKVCGEMGVMFVGGSGVDSDCDLRKNSMMMESG